MAEENAGDGTDVSESPMTPVVVIKSSGLQEAPPAEAAQYVQVIDSLLQRRGSAVDALGIYGEGPIPKRSRNAPLARTSIGGGGGASVAIDTRDTPGTAVNKGRGKKRAASGTAVVVVAAEAPGPRRSRRASSRTRYYGEAQDGEGDDNVQDEVYQEVVVSVRSSPRSKKKKTPAKGTKLNAPAKKRRKRGPTPKNKTPKKKKRRNVWGQDLEVMLKSAESVLGGANLREILTWESFCLLSEQKRDKLLALLPSVDKTDPAAIKRVFGDEFFKRDTVEYQGKLIQGQMDDSIDFFNYRKRRSRRGAEEDTGWTKQDFERYYGETHDVVAARRMAEPTHVHSFVAEKMGDWESKIAERGLEALFQTGAAPPPEEAAPRLDASTPRAAGAEGPEPVVVTATPESSPMWNAVQSFYTTQ